jgi:hypothetical protein
MIQISRWKNGIAPMAHFPQIEALRVPLLLLEITAAGH